MDTTNQTNGGWKAEQARGFGRLSKPGANVPKN